MADLPNVDDVLDAEPPAQGQQTADQILDNADSQTQLAQNPLGSYSEYGVPQPGSSPENDAWLAQSPIGHVLDAFGQGAKAGWGTDEIVHPDTAALLQKAGVLSDVKDGQTGIVKSFNDALLRPAAAGLDLAIRGAGQAYRASSAVFGGGLEAAVEAGTQIGGNQFGRGVGELGEFLLTDAGAHIPMHPEALPRGELLGRELGRTLDRAASNTEVPPAPFSLRSVGDLETSRSLGVLGTEAEWKGYAPTEDFPAGTTTSYSAPVEATPEGAPMQPYAPTLSPDVAPAAEPTNIHEAARQIAPDTFHEFDALTQDREQLSNTIAAESEALRRNAEQQMPGGDRIADLEARIQQMTPKMAADLQGRIDDIRGGWDQSTLDALGRDTPELAAMRQQLQVIDYRMRDLAPDVTAAYRGAAERFPMVEEETPPPPLQTHPTSAPGEPNASPLQAAEEANPGGDLNPQNSAEPVTVQGGNEAQPPAAETPAATPEPAPPPINIAQDVAAKLQAAGRPAEEAQAAGAVQEALWRTRAEAFGGRKGTAEEMYAREAPEIRRGEEARNLELAQRDHSTVDRELYQRIEAARGSGSTQIATTTPMYRKAIAMLLKRSPEATRALDYGAGLGMGADAMREEAPRMQVHSFEPNPERWKGKEPPTFTKSDDINGKYDIVTNTNVLNVLPKNIRDMVVKDIGDKLAPDGHALITARGWSGDVAAAKNFEDAGEHHAILIKKGDEKVFQKGFDGNELKDYVSSVLGDGFKVEKVSGYGKAGVIVTRTAEGVRELSQTTRGSLSRPKNARWYISLFKDANASTFIHETGHDWAERMLRDAADPDASPAMRDDASAVRKYLGNDGGDLTKGQHEKFARSFERYFMEGRAPSSALARVFEQFKSWLTTIYQTVSRLRAPITDDIRDVFDRLLTSNPDRQPVLALDRDRDLAGHVEPKTPFATIPKEPTRLAAFVRKMGGVQEESGEIKAMLGGDYRRRPGLMNSTGMTHDLMAIEAMHAGYFPGYEEQHTLPPNILLERLREDLNGNPQYSMHDQEAADAYHEALARNSEVERLANKYGVDPTGLTHDQFFDKIAEAESTENLADSIRNTEDHLVEDFGDMHAEVRDTTEPPHYGITEPRTLEDLENEARQADDSRYGEQGTDRAERPGLVGSPEGAGEVGGGQVGGVAGAEGGGGTEVRSGGAAAGDGQSAGPGEREPVSDGGESGAEPEPSLEPIDVKTEAPEFATKGDRDIEKAANIRLDKLNTPDDMNDVLRDIARKNGDYMDARYGTAAYQTEREIENTRILLRLATSDLMEASKKAQGMDPKAVADMLVAEQRASMVFQKLSTLSADWAHAGHALNRVMDGMQAVKAVTDLMGKDRDLFQKSVAERVAAYAAMDNPEQAAKLASDLTQNWKVKGKNMILSYFINNLISGPLTHGAYTVATDVMNLYRAVPETAAQAVVGAIRQGLSAEPITDRVYFREIMPQLYGMMRGFRDGITPAVRAFKTGVPELAGGPQGELAMSLNTRQQVLPGKVGRFLEAPSRAVSFLHTLNYSMSYSQELARLAARQAGGEGLVGDAFNARVASLRQSPSAALMEAASDAGLHGTLMTRPTEGFQKDLVAMSNKYMALKLAVPFMQIGTNILKEGVLDRTALSMLSSDARAELMSGGAARDIRIGKIAAGSALGLATMGLVMEGSMTGGGPSDPEQRRMLLATGWQPYSVRIGDTYYPYRKWLGPLGPLVAAHADLYEIGHALTHEGLGQAAGALAFGFAEVVASETWMSGISNLIEAIHDPGRNAETYLRNLATSFLPWSVGSAQIARMIDPYQRRARTLIEAAQNKIPFASEALEPQIGVFGQPVTSHTMLSPSAYHADPVVDRLRALGIAITPLRKDLVGIPMTEQQYTKAAVTAGQMMHQRLTALVTVPGWAQQVPPGQQTIAIQKIINESRMVARQQLKMEDAAQSLAAGKRSIIEKAAQNKLNLKVNGKGGAY